MLVEIFPECFLAECGAQNLSMWSRNEMRASEGAPLPGLDVAGAPVRM